MALDGGVLVVRVIADGSKLSASVASATQVGVGKATSGIAAAGQKLTAALMNPLVQVGALAAGVVAKLGFDFEDAFTRISAISNASSQDIAKWKEEVLDLSGATAQSPKELADALFFLSSAGLESSQVMEALDVAAKASAVGLGDTADVANIVASALNAYADSGLTAASVTDTLVAAVREGRAEPEEFAQALGRILPIASEAGVTFDQVAASMAGLSNIGLDVNEGTTAMRGALQAIVAPGAQAAHAMKDLGLSAQELLTAIQNQGLLGAFELLKQRAEANTTTQADYLGVLRKVIPNVRALTGVLGLSGDQLEKNAIIFERVKASTGALAAALAETQRGNAFQFRQTINDLVVAGTELGRDVLPAITSGLKVIVPILTAAGKVAKGLLTALIAYKALNFLPGLLLKSGASMLQFGSVGQTAGKAAIGLGTAMTTLSSVALPVAVGIGIITESVARMHAENDAAKAAVTSFTDTLIQRYAAGEISATALENRLNSVFQAAPEWARETLGLAGSQEELTASTKATEFALGRAGMAQAQFAREAALVAKETEKASHFTDQAGKSVRNFANLTSGAKGTLKEFRAATVTAMSAVAGSLADAGAVWTLSANAAVRGAARMAAAQQRLARDLKELDKLPVGDKFTKFLLEQGPQAVDAFIQGNKSQRSAIRNSFKVFDEAAQETNKAVKDITTKGGEEAGKGLADGAARGVLAGSAAAAAAAARLGHLMVEELRAAMGVSSPSKEGIKVGISLIDGVVKGMEQRFSKIEDALRNLVPLIQKTLGVGAADQARAFLDDFTKVETKLRGLTREFDKLKNKIRDFRGAIVGGFSEFADLMGGIASQLADFQAAQEQFVADQAAGVTDLVAPQAPDISAFVQAQVAGARELAQKLSQLQKAGLSTANLAALAGQGAAAIPAADVLLGDPALIQELNEAQQAIADITQSEADKLTNARFGEKVARLGEEFTELQDRLDTLTDRFGRFIGALHVNEINDETQELVDALRQFRNMLGNMGVTVPTGGPGVNPAPPGRTPPAGSGDTLVFNFNGAVADKDQVTDWVHEGLLRKQARNSTLGIR